MVITISENLNHETGGSFQDNNVVSEQSANIKFIIIQSAEPTNKYDGQNWVDINEDPPLKKVYDDTNADWVDREGIIYETGHNELPSFTPLRDGLMVVEWDATDGKAALWLRANNWWWAVRSS